MEATSSSEAWVKIYQSSRRPIQKFLNVDQYAVRPTNLASHTHTHARFSLKYFYLEGVK